MLQKAKFQCPKTSSELIVRPELQIQFDTHADSPCLLVTAPAGYGKTSAVSEWIARRPNSGWLSLDEHGNTLDRFLQHLLHAIRQLNSELGKSASTMLVADQKTDWLLILESLLNDVSKQIIESPI